MVTLKQGDYLELMRDIPDGSVDMVLCDLPYGTVKGLNLNGWADQSTEWDNRINTAELFAQYERVLRQNGVAVLFSQEPYTSELRTHRQSNLYFLYPLIWKKDHFANALGCKSAPVSYFEDLSVFCKKYDTTNSHPLRKYAAAVMKWAGVGSVKDINKRLGHRRAEHFFYVTSTQFALCTEQTYKELTDAYNLQAMSGYMRYAELVEIDHGSAEQFARVFNLPEGQKYFGNILEYRKDYTRQHPTQKPVALLERLIEVYTNPGDTVLDNCMGSGSTGVACKNTGRRFIGYELDPDYFNTACERLGVGPCF